MGLEDLPRMHLLSKDEKPIELREGMSFSGKFAVLGGEGNQVYVVGAENRKLRHSFFRVVFEYYVERQFGEDIDVSDLTVRNGGFLDIAEKTIRLHGQSIDFGKYNKRQVEPIVEEWRDTNLPGYKVSFE